MGTETNKIMKSMSNWLSSHQDLTQREAVLVCVPHAVSHCGSLLEKQTFSHFTPLVKKNIKE